MVVVAFKVKFHVTCQIIHLLTDRWRWRDSDRETDREKQTINQKMRIFRFQFENLSKQLIPNNLPRLEEFMDIAI